MRSLVKLFAFTLILGAAFFPIYAFASSNMEAGAHGEAAVLINGWAISNVRYQLAQDPTLVQSVTLDLDGPADNVSVKLDSNSNEFTACINTNASHWQCIFAPGVKLSSMDEFRVIAAGH
jgi:hypothetical protein